MERFEDGLTAGWEVSDDGTAVGWQVLAAPETDGAAPYFGDPATMTYGNGGRAAGRVMTAPREGRRPAHLVGP